MILSILEIATSHFLFVIDDHEERVEKISLSYQVISIGHWIRMLFTVFKMLLSIQKQMAIDPPTENFIFPPNLFGFSFIPGALNYKLLIFMNELIQVLPFYSSLMNATAFTAYRFHCCSPHSLETDHYSYM
jgi:hypothetical protein